MQTNLSTLIENTAKDGHYSQHLAEISNKGNQAQTTEDILNADGVMLVRGGVSIDAGLRNKLLQHKLLKPLHFQVGLESQLDAVQLIGHFKQMQGQNIDIKRVNEAHHFTDEFEEFLKSDVIPSVILQKLTVMNSQLPHEFQKSLFCAWFAMLTAKEMGLDQESITNAFLAALVHDVGIMHLDPDIVQSKRQLNSNEWRMLQAHVIIGKIITDAIPELHPDISRAVLEHHETCFGSGYPYALSGMERGLLGRIIGMADGIHALHVKQKDNRRTLGDVIPYLQLNSNTQSTEVYRAVLSIIKKSELSPSIRLPKNSIQAYAQQLASEAEVMQKMKSALELMYSDMNNFLDSNLNDKYLTTLHAIINRMMTTLNESGLLSIELLHWLQEIAFNGDKSALAVLNEIDLLTNELNWQLRNTMRMLESYYEKVNNKNPALASSIKYSATVIQYGLTELYNIANAE